MPLVSFYTILCKIEPVCNCKGNNHGNSSEIPVTCQLYQLLQQKCSVEFKEKHQPQKYEMSLVSGIRVT